MDALSRLAATFFLNALWQVMLVAGLALVADRFLRRAPARFRHNLWVIALAAAVALPLASLQPALARRGSVTYTLGPLVPVGRAVPDQSSAGFWQSAKAWVKQAAQDGIPLPRPWERGLLALYAAFLGIEVVRLARAWRRARQISSRASPSVAPARINSLVEDCRRAMAPSGRSPGNRLRVLISPEIPGPVTVGACRTAIVLPEKLLGKQYEAELRAALAHEIAHIERRDYLRNLIHEIVLLPISFHPLALLISRRLARTRELACDEMAAAVLGRQRYVRSLVSMANKISRFSTGLEEEFTLGVFDADILEDRVMKLLDPRPLSSDKLSKITLLVGTVLIAACSLAAAGFSLAAAPNAPESTKASITGIVVDSSGARLSKAQVWLKGHTDSAPLVKTTVTDASGNFSFADVAPGRYTLGADFPGAGMSSKLGETAIRAKAMSYRTITVASGGPPSFYPFVLESAAAGGGATQPARVNTAPQAIRVNGALEQRKVISQPPPKYPPSAKARGVQGKVEIDALISAAGVPEKLRVVSSPDKELSKAALDAVRLWRYKPTRLNGKPIAVETTIDVDFELKR